MGNPFFVSDVIGRIHKRFQVFLHSSNMNCLDDVETGLLSEFGKLQHRLEQGKWITSTPIWVEFPI